MLGYLLLGLLAHGSAENATVYQLTDLDLWCIDKLGISTTTTSTPWFVTSADLALAEERAQFRANVKRDGWLMAEEFQAWLEVRVYATLLCLTFGTPLLVIMLYRYSSTFRKWVTVIDRNLTFGRCFMLLVAVFVIAAGLCWFFSLRIVYTTRLVMQDLQDYFLSSFSTRLMDIAISEFDHFTTDNIGKQVQIGSYLCNPTDGVFELRSFGVDCVFSNQVFATIDLSQPIHLEPQTVGEMFIDYNVLQHWNNLVLPAINTVINSAMGRVGLADAVVTLSFVITTDCVARDTQIFLGIKANVPIGLAKLPEIWAWNQSFYEDTTQFWADLYKAVNKGLKTERFLEWDSLNIHGEVMTEVFLIVVLCSVILVSAIFLVMLLLLKSGCQCRICRRRPVETNSLNPVCPEKVWGRSVSDLEIIVADETPQAKPHLTKAMSQSRLASAASIPKGPKTIVSS